MKIKITVFFCSAVLLAALLTGCGTAAQMEATSETTEPAALQTEPMTFFEEQGFTLWEGFTVEDDPEIREIHGTRELPNGMQVSFYEKKDGPVEEILHKEIIGTSLDVHICKYFAEDFGMENIANVVDSFYRADLEKNSELTKEQWLESHQDSVILNCWYLMRSAVSEAAEQFHADAPEGDYAWNISSGMICVMDRNAGTVFDADSDHLKEVGQFSLNNDNETVDFSALIDGKGLWVDSEKSDYRDTVLFMDMYVLVPMEYEDLAFMLVPAADYQPDEELLKSINGTQNEEDEDEDPAWYERSWQEFAEKYDYYEFYYAAMD